MPERGTSGWREEAGWALELAALTGFAVTQPVLDVFGRSPETFIALGAGRAELVGFAAVVAVAVPLALAGLATTTRVAGARTRSAVQVALVAALAAVVAAQVLRHATGWAGRVTAPAAVALAAAATAAYARLAAVRTWLRIASFAPLLSALLFLAASPASDLLDTTTAGAGAAGAGGDLAPVVLVVLDELPTVSLLDGRGRIDRELFPNFAALADDATWYRNATTVSPNTLESVPAILTGRFPPEGQTAPTAGGYPGNLFSLLADTHAVNGHEWITALCPPGLCARAGGGGGALGELLGRAVDVWWERTWPGQGGAPAVDRRAEDLLADRSRPGRFDRFLAGMAAGDRPGLDVLHIALPHSGWWYLPSGQEYEAPDAFDHLVFTAWPTIDRAAAARQRHLLQLQYTDTLIGRLVDRLRALGRYDESAVVVTADHGITFRLGEVPRTIDDDTEEDLAWVPLLVKAPGQRRGAVRDANVLTIDVVPTILDLLGVDPPDAGAVDGVDGVNGVNGVDGVNGVPAGRRDDPAKPIDARAQNELSNVEGGVGHVDPDRFASVLRARAAPPGDPALRVWRTGRLGHLVGRRVDAFPAGAPADASVALDVPAGLASLDPGAEVLPLYVSGRVEPNRAMDVALAVNGVIAGWSEVWTWPPWDGGFGAVLAAPLLDPGRNDVTAYAVEGRGRATALRPLRAGALG